MAAAQAAALVQLQCRSARWASHTAGAAVGAVVLAYRGPHAAHIAAFMRQLAHGFIRPQVPGPRPPTCGARTCPAGPVLVERRCGKAIAQVLLYHTMPHVPSVVRRARLL